MAFPADSPLTATALATAAVSVALASLVWWRRLARLNVLRRQVAAIRQLSRETVHAPDAASAAARIEQSLRRILCSPDLKVSISLPGDGAPVATITTNRLEFPLFPENKENGILLVYSESELEFHPEILDSLGDLAQHAAIALEMREQRRLKDQVARGEQLAASSLLMSGIARELRPLLESIHQEARQAGRESLAAEAESALHLVDRLAALGEPGLARPSVFDLAAAVRELCGLRRHAWSLMQLEAVASFPDQPLHIRAPRSLLEEALLGLLVAAEHSQQELPERRLGIMAAQRAGLAVLTITLPPVAPATIAAGSIASLRSLVESCGGQFLELQTASELRFELRFPLEAAAPPQDARREQPPPARQLTLLLVHPDLEALRPLIRAVAERGHRAVPATDAVQALEMAARLRFDAAFASPLLHDLDWPEFAARLKVHVPIAGWLAPPSRPAPAGVPSVPLQPSASALDELPALVEATTGPAGPSISS